MKPEDKPDIVGLLVRMPRASKDELKSRAKMAGVSLEEYVRNKLGVPNPGTIGWMQAVLKGLEGGNDGSESEG